MYVCCFFFFKQKTAYEMRISDWSSDVCSSDLDEAAVGLRPHAGDGQVVLVGDIADDLLQDVLQRHHALQAAVFVDDQREMLPARPERLELVEQAGRVGDEPGRCRDLPDVEAVESPAPLLDGAQEEIGRAHV